MCSRTRLIGLGLDQAGDVFHLHALAVGGKVVRRKLSRAELLAFFSRVEPAVIGVAARADAAHWAKRLAVLGHDVRLLPPGRAKFSGRRGPAVAKNLCEALMRAGARRESRDRGPSNQDIAGVDDFAAVARTFSRRAAISRATKIQDLIDTAQWDPDDAAPDALWLALVERLAPSASRRRSITADALACPPCETGETPAAPVAGPEGDHQRAQMLFVHPAPPLREAPAVRARGALVASIDAEALARLQDLALPADSAAARKIFRRWRRLRSVAQTGLFLPDYYAYQTRIEGSPFSILMHYLNEVPEMAAQPNPLFNTNYYLIANRRTRRALHPFIEYALYRRHQGATTHWTFSDAAYAERAGVETGEAMAHCIDHYAAWAGPQAASALVAAHAGCDTRDIASFVFDPACYARLYEDMAALSPNERVAHYQRHGAREGRFGCVGAYLHALGADNFFVPVDFDPHEYAELNPDIAALDAGERPMLTFEHFLKHGLFEGRHYTRKAFAVARPSPRRAEDAGAPAETLPVGIFVHMFYPDMWPAISAYLRNMRDAERRLFVNLVTSSFDADVFAQIRRDYPDAQILVSPNEGRDIGGLFRLFAEADFSRLGAVAICHSKKSPHLTAGLGQTWMRDLMDAYADKPETFAESLRAIREDPHVGIIASAKWRRRGVGEANDRHYKLISSLLPALKGQNPEYPSGTMFLAKPAIVEGVYAALKHLEFENGDGLDLKFHVDGQIAHSVERAFGHMARSLALDIWWR